MIAALAAFALMAGEEPAPAPEPWLAIKGRVVGHAGVAHHRDLEPPAHLELAVMTARLAVRAQVSEKVEAVIEAELAGKPALKDGFAQHETSHTLVRAGQFKMPNLALTTRVRVGAAAGAAGRRQRESSPTSSWSPGGARGRCSR